MLYLTAGNWCRFLSVSQWNIWVYELYDGIAAECSSNDKMIREYWSQRNQSQRTTDRSKTNYAKSPRKRTTSAELSTKSVRVINVGELLLSQSLWHVDLLPAAGGTSALGSPPLWREPATCVTCGDVAQGAKNPVQASELVTAFGLWAKHWCDHLLKLGWYVPLVEFCYMAQAFFKCCHWLVKPLQWLRNSPNLDMDKCLFCWHNLILTQMQQNHKTAWIWLRRHFEGTNVQVVLLDVQEHSILNNLSAAGWTKAGKSKGSTSRSPGWWGWCGE